MIKTTFSKYYLLLILLLPLSLFSQENVKNNSPYSRLGLGDLFNQNFTMLSGMGGLSAAFQDSRQSNILNPASLASLRLTTFEAGLYAKYASLDDGTNQAQIWSGNLAYLSLGFSTRNRLNAILDRKQSPWAWGMNVSLVPFSTVDYGIEIQSPIRDSMTVYNNFSGSGGTYRFLWGNGVSYKDFSFGVNLGFIFGNLNSLQTTTIDDEQAYALIDTRDISIGGFVWNAGAQYSFQLSKDPTDGTTDNFKKSLVLGIYGNNSTGFNTTSDVLIYRAHVRNPTDTIQNTAGVEQSGTLPTSLSFGAIYQVQNRLRVGFNYDFTQWSDFTMEAKQDETLRDGWRMAVGAAYTPDHISYNNYFKRVNYQLGLLYEQDPRFDLQRTGITIGGSFPIILPRQTTSYINFSVEGGKLTGTDTIDELYARMNLSFTLNDDSWFFKRKFN
ncbi:MAG: hypothetical protein KDC24_04160 [Saprospiraceae bacterium]|nr:hypothetical protein [Saprospiraceae bacterium]